MVDLQELIQRGRLLLSNSPKRTGVFELVNGKNSTKDISLKVKRSLSSVNQDLEKLRDMGLIIERKNGDKVIKKAGALVYEKIPLIKHVPLSYFEPVARTATIIKKPTKKKGFEKQSMSINVPSTNEILEICKHGEDQIYEFKEPGVETEKITREIAGLLHTKGGGIVFYG